VRIFGLDHVTIECPDGGQEKARLFYGQALGLREVPVPQNPHRPSIGFQCGDQEIHLGFVDPTTFVAQERGHPALVVDHLSAWLRELAQIKVAIEEAIPDPRCHNRCYIRDPFGNRIELREPDTMRETTMDQAALTV